MNRLKLLTICLLISMHAHAGVSWASFPEPVRLSFSYQGELADAGSPANGDYDFEFKLFDCDAGGTMIGVTMTLADVTVTNGRFTVVLEPQIALDGTRTFLEIAVRPGASGGAYTILTPRQELTATPYALGLRPEAEIADSGTLSSWLLTIRSGTGSLATGLLVDMDGDAISARSMTGTPVSGNYLGNGITPGVFGVSASPAVNASAISAGMTGAGTDATSAGVRGINQGAGMGVYGEHEASTGAAAGVMGVTQSLTQSAAGVVGEVASTFGVALSAGVRGVNNGTAGGSHIGVHGIASGAGRGVYGETGSGSGVRGFADTGTGVFALSNTGTIIDGWSEFQRRFRVDNNGNVTADGTFSSPSADFAELLPAVGEVEPGDVLAIDVNGDLTRSARPYDSAVVGVHSTRPAFLGGAGSAATDDANVDSKIPLAVVGVVPVKVTNENGPITPGDLLVASSLPGHAMRASNDPPNGTVIGKALQPANERNAVIKAILILQ